ncbi:oxidoreductase [Photobacterium sp. BZF1]|uniref:oxidoreductase n=1 Tax=Photobacterium sp. BZF1 TaxID=1904457 RepID=UPI001653B97D|nr:oxidoreductase [Photobacterium sp. BZF1]MBC7005072.1 oxidoreductase [Photobacterium sp. BZF1]
MQPIKTAIVGFGISGQCFQVPIIEYCDELKLTAVVSSDKQKVIAQLPNVTVYSQIETMLDDPDIELVIIATPNHLHIPQAKLALQAGKHVVIEKPFCISAEEGKALMDVAQQAGKTLSVYQSRRFDGDFRTIEKLTADGKLGDIHTFYSSYNRYRPEVKVRWREQDTPGAGILYDLGAHLIDQTLCLFGLPEKVTAVVRNQRPGAQATDHFHLILHYPQCEAILHANCLSTTEGPRFQIFGHDSAFIKYGMDPQEDMLRDKAGPGTPGWGEDTPDNFGRYTDKHGHNTIIETERGGYEQFYQQLALAIREGHPLPVTAEQALDVIRVIEAAIASSEQQCSVRL